MTERFCPTRSMSDLWNDLARENAQSAVLYHSTDEWFEESGKIEAAWLWRLMRQLCADAVRVPDEARHFCVLDIGGGLGRIAKHLAPLVRRYTLLDCSQEMLAQAQVRMPNLGDPGPLRCVLGNGYDLTGVDSGCVDFALSEICFQHVDREVVVRYLLDLPRVLRPGGHAYIQIPPMEYPARFDEAKRGDWPANFRRWHTGEVLEVAVRAGLSVLAANPEGGEYLFGRGVDVNWQRQPVEPAEEEGADGDE